jgi:F420H(2)-dependent quinone reductase
VAAVALVQRGPAHADPTGTVDACKSANPDKILYVPITFDMNTISSGSGFYGYRSPGCAHWIADIKMATYSNSYTPDGKHPQDVILTGGYVDLPSSVGAGSLTEINNQEDCQRYIAYVRFYKKLSTESAFTMIGHAVFKGQWQAGDCNLYKSSGTTGSVTDEPSKSGWDTYRYRVALRRDAGGTPHPVGELDSVATRADARRQGHASRLILLALEALQEAGCDWALLVATGEASRRLYERHGWRCYPEPWRRGTITGALPQDDRRYLVRPLDVLHQPAGWEQIAAVDIAVNRGRPLTVVRDAAYWRGYAALRVGAWTPRPSSPAMPWSSTAGEPPGSLSASASTAVTAARTSKEMSMSTIEGEYAPNTMQWVRDQVELYERTGGREGNTLLDTGMPVIIVTMKGRTSGMVRKIALMRVEHDGQYALVASLGGAPKHPVWYHNLKADPATVTIQDGPEPFPVVVREADGEERERWWQRAVAAYPPYAEYQQRTSRVIPILIATRKG